MDIMKLDIKLSRTGTGRSYVKMLSDILNDERYDSDQKNQIRLGIDSGVDISLYADHKFDSDQMWQIRLGLKDGVDTSLYADPKFGWEQMSQIKSY